MRKCFFFLKLFLKQEYIIHNHEKEDIEVLKNALFDSCLKVPCMICYTH